MHPIIIIGTGMAAYTLAREFRKLDKQTPLKLITADDGNSYSKPMLSNAFLRKKDASSLVLASAEKMASDLNLTILTHTTVTKIIASENILETNKENQQYSHLVFATGANPIKIPMAGDAANEILSINNLSDYSNFRKVINNKKHIAILGPGLIGCEFANDLSNAGYDVTVIGPGKLPLENLIPEETGLALKDSLSKLGVKWKLESLAKEVSKNKNNYTLKFEDGSTLNADVVLSAVGLRPATTLAEAAELKINRGIVVNRNLQCSVKNIYAIGDCMEIDEMVFPFIMPIMHCARALAATLTGETTPVNFPAMPVTVKTPAYDLITCPPHPKLKGDWKLDVQSDNNGIKSCYYDKKDSLLGFTLSGEKTSEKQALVKNLPGYLD